MKEPLVSIVVITYNSSKYVLETLESCKVQTYKNIELIISDDGSKDDTVRICEDWLEENRERFQFTKLIKVEKNTGIPANCNRGVKASEGEWIKLIAGDDVLLTVCIELNFEYSKTAKNLDFLFSRVTLINEHSDIWNKDNSLIIHTDFYELDAEKQYERLIKAERISVTAPSGFLRKKKIIELGGFDENIKLCEDYPMWIIATKNDVKLQFMDKITVLYRMHSNSLMSQQSKNFSYEMQRIFFKYRFRPLLRTNFILALDLYVRYIIRPHTFLKIWVPYFLPLTYFNFFRKKFN
jgi:alpha-1,3-rhamnosyltransferase